MKKLNLFASFWLVLSVLLLSTSCNVSAQRVKGVGKSTPTESNVNINNVVKIYANSSIDVEAVPSVERKVIVTAQDNIKDLILIKVVGNAVQVEFKPAINVSTSDVTKVTFYLPEIQELVTNGSGDIHCSRGFSSGADLSVKANGSGDIKVSDIECAFLRVAIDGSGDIEIKNVKCREIKTSVDGSGDVDVENFTCEKVTTIVNGSGDIEYRGNVNEHVVRIEGSGSLEAYDLKTNITQVDVRGSGDSHVWATNKLDLNIDGSGDIYYKGAPAVDIYKQGSGKAIPRPIKSDK